MTGKNKKNFPFPRKFLSLQPYSGVISLRHVTSCHRKRQALYFPGRQIVLQSAVRRPVCFLPYFPPHSDPLVPENSPACPECSECPECSAYTGCLRISRYGNLTELFSEFTIFRRFFMKRKSLSVAVIIAMLFSVFIPLTVSASSVSVRIDNIPVSFSESTGYPFIDAANRTQVPLRCTMESYGCEVQWNGTSRTAVVQKNGITVQVPVGKTYILINGKTSAIDTAAVIRNNRTDPRRAGGLRSGSHMELFRTVCHDQLKGTGFRLRKYRHRYRNRKNVYRK